MGGAATSGIFIIMITWQLDEVCFSFHPNSVAGYLGMSGHRGWTTMLWTWWLFLVTVVMFRHSTSAVFQSLRWFHIAVIHNVLDIIYMYYYCLRSRGDNVFGSVRLFICLCVKNIIECGPKGPKLAIPDIPKNCIFTGTLQHGSQEVRQRSGIFYSSMFDNKSLQGSASLVHHYIGRASISGQ